MTKPFWGLWGDKQLNQSLDEGSPSLYFHGDNSCFHLQYSVIIYFLLVEDLGGDGIAFFGISDIGTISNVSLKYSSSFW